MTSTPDPLAKCCPICGGDDHDVRDKLLPMGASLTEVGAQINTTLLDLMEATDPASVVLAINEGISQIEELRALTDALENIQHKLGTIKFRRVLGGPAKPC